MTQPSGWYEDPQDPSQLRYWDGVVWSANTSPKVSPTVAKSTIGMPYGVTATSERPPPGMHGAYGSPTQDQGRPGGQWPPYRQGSGSMGGQQPGWQSHPPTTPDGAMLAGWWMRVGARVLDGILVFALALPFTGWFYYRYIAGLLDFVKDAAAQAPGSAPVVAVPPWDVYQFGFAASVIGLLVAGAYEVFFLKRSGATPGKKIVGISVRLRDKAGPPPMQAILFRTGCYLGLSILSPANWLDALWPLWDDKKQAIHDKVAKTNVVLGPQPPRDT
jgi:uncharacterized RDD family membrane protein YckC